MVKDYSKVYERYYAQAAPHQSLSSSMPTDEQLATAIATVMRAHRLTGWRPDESPVRPFVVAWVDTGAPLDVATAWQAVSTHASYAPAYEWRREQQRGWCAQGMATVEELRVRPPRSPYSLIDGVWVGTARPRPGDHEDDAIESLLGLAILAEYGGLEACGIDAARYRHPLLPTFS